MRDKMLIARTPRIPLIGIVLLLSTAVPFVPFSSTCVRIADAAAPITPSGFNTQVSGPIAVGTQTQYNITGGTRPGGGTNLFHSFGQFNVPTNNIANFLNETALPTNNILARVTGGNLSSIYGIIQTTGFGNANLFLMNPAGFLFGPNATVNVGGMVAFTSADYLRLADGVRFNATPNAAADALLTPSPVAAFGFLGSNPGAITVQGSQFTVTEGTGISLVGGNITIQSGTLDNGTVQSAKLSAPGGQINLASIVSPGEILLPNLQPAQLPGGTALPTLGSITLSEGSILDVSGNAAGTVRIRGGQLVIADATILADTGNANGASTAIDINVTGDLSITDTRGVPALSARTTGNGDAGAIQIDSANLIATSTSPAPTPFALIDSHTSSSGNAGNVNITTGDLQVSYQQSGVFQFIDSGTAGPGRGGDVSITAQNIILQNTGISTGDFLDRLLSSDPSGTGGNVSITTGSLQLTTAVIDTGAFLAFDASQQAGNVSIKAHDITMSLGAGINALGFGGGGAINIQADTLVMNNAALLTETAAGPGGGVTITARTFDLTNGSQVLSTTVGDGQAGNIRVTAIDYFTLSTAPTNPNPSGLFSNSTGDIGNGNAGAIVVNTPILQMTGGSRINTATASSGRGGDVTINATNSISISGEFHGGDPEPIFGIGTIHPSGIFTASVGGACSPCGDAGNISITTGSLTLGSGGQINSGTSTSGRGGDITIHATDAISLSETLSDGSPAGIFSRSIGTDPGSGAGGNITLTAGQSVSLSNGASISASSTGPGNTGNISINAGNQFAMTNSTVTTEANQASGGIIKITTDPNGTVQLTNSTISASVLDGTGGGGNVNIDPQFVILQNSQILAQAVQGPGGNIAITTNLLLPDANSMISASSQFGVNGTVTIQSPNAPASGKIQPLGKSPLLATTLLNQRCAALAGGEFSSFTVAGRDSLPAEPGSWLASPLAALSVDARPAVRGEGLAGMTSGASLEETALLSLRQIAPAGFLTQAFAVDWSAGCTS